MRNVLPPPNKNLRSTFCAYMQLLTSPVKQATNANLIRNVDTFDGVVIDFLYVNYTGLADL